MKNEDIKKMNIYEKMSAITNELGVVAKNLNVDMGKGKSYKAVQEKDVLDAVKPIEEKYRVYSYPKERKIIDYGILEKETQYGVSKNQYLRIETTYEFVNLDNTSEVITMTSYADGIDSGDKATGKAMTYSDKYSLLKAYKIATGDDPDKEASPEKGYSNEELKTKELLIQIKELMKIKKVLPNEISEALGRGKHTTRYITLVNLFGGKVLDTPGFSQIDLSVYDPIEDAEELERLRKEMNDFYDTQDKWLIQSGGANAKSNAISRIFGENARYEGFLTLINLSNCSSS